MVSRQNGKQGGPEFLQAAHDHLSAASVPEPVNRDMDQSQSLCSPHQLPDSMGKRSDWFACRRDFFVRRVLEEFFFIREKFGKIFYKFQLITDRSPVDVAGELAGGPGRSLYEDVEKLVGSESEKGALWLLKNLCHRVWPRNTHHPERTGCLVDWLMGSLFHEAVKFKENLYMITSYGTAGSPCLPCGTMAEAEGDIDPPGSTDTDIDMQEFSSRIAADIVSQVGIMRGYCDRINFMLREMLRDLTRNPLVIRLLLEKEEKVLELWRESVGELFADIFPGGAVEGFCSAGRSYFAAQWYNRALEAYNRALDENIHCDEAIVRISHLKALLAA